MQRRVQTDCICMICEWGDEYEHEWNRRLTMSMNEAEVNKSGRGRWHMWRARHSEAILAAHSVIVIIVVDRPAIGL